MRRQGIPPPPPVIVGREAGIYGYCVTFPSWGNFPLLAYLEFVEGVGGDHPAGPCAAEEMATEHTHGGATRGGDN